MDSDHAQTPFSLGLILKALGRGVMLFSTPVMMLLRALKAIFYILTLPIRIPWHMYTWCLEEIMTLMEDYEHFFFYFTCAVITGTASGIFTAVLTDLVATWLRWLLPFLCRRPQRQQPQQQQQRRQRQGQRPEEAAARPRRPAPRHVASAIYWSSDEEADGQDKPASFIPPSRRHGYSPKKPPPPPSAHQAGPSASSSAWSPSSSRGSRHRAQQPAKARVAVADTIHEESSVSEHERPGLWSTRGW